MFVAVAIPLHAIAPHGRFQLIGRDDVVVCRFGVGFAMCKTQATAVHPAFHNIAQIDGLLFVLFLVQHGFGSLHHFTNEWFVQCVG